MALISMRQLLDHAAENDYGVPAFNVNNLEQMRAIMEGADETNSPVIVQASAGARKYAGPNFLRHLILAAVEEFPTHTGGYASRPRCISRRLPAFHADWFHLSDDGRLLAGRSKNPGRL